MSVIIFKGHFQYDVVTQFSTAIGEVLESKGMDVDYIDLNSPHAFEELVKALRKDIDFIIGFNGIGYEIKYDGISLYDYLGIPYIMWLVDHPVHINNRVSEPIHNKIVVCIDETHVDFMEQYFIEEIVTSFIPHAVSIKDFSNGIEKLYDVIFAGHIASPEELDHVLVKIEQFIPNLRKLIGDKLKWSGNFDLGQLLLELYESYPAFHQLCQETATLATEVLCYIDKYIRAVKREFVIEQLLNAEISIDFFGVLPENHRFKQNPYFKHHGVLPFEDMQRTFSKAKMVLNVLPNFPNGGHERIVTSMMCGAVPITDTNVYVNEHFQHSIRFDYPHVESAIQEIKGLLQDDCELQKRIQLNYETVIAQHTWEHRVDELLYVIDVAKQYFKNNQKK